MSYTVRLLNTVFPVMAWFVLPWEAGEMVFNFELLPSAPKKKIQWFRLLMSPINSGSLIRTPTWKVLGERKLCSILLWREHISQGITKKETESPWIGLPDMKFQPWSWYFVCDLWQYILCLDVPVLKFGAEPSNRLQYLNHFCSWILISMMSIICSRKGSIYSFEFKLWKT